MKEFGILVEVKLRRRDAGHRYWYSQYTINYRTGGGVGRWGVDEWGGASS